jgi:uncharacterized membrane protein YeaQ/YmgE (transglycosylase-associated protein family)
MNLLIWLVFGALVGWSASMIMGTDERQGSIGNIVVGIIGAFLGGFVMNLIGQPGVSGFNFYSTFVAILGAVVLLWIYKMFSRRSV